MTKLRLLPSIEHLRQRDAIRSLATDYGPKATLATLRTVVESLRQEISNSDPPQPDDREQAAIIIEQRTALKLASAFKPSLTSVINATGVIVHTNLGRAPLAANIAQHVAGLAGNYTNLEYSLTTGQRGSRHIHSAHLLTQLTGAPAALVVNNNAAAVMLTLAALAKGREVIVSRGELVEIGGGFRIPDIMRQSGTQLREVGTTNKTRAADFAAAINDRTALILVVHPSNFRIEGFTERPNLTDLVTLGKRFNIPIVEDLGSGNLLPLAEQTIDDPSVRTSISAGVSVCCFSGDKLLGGPQAGIIIGHEALLKQLSRHPLMRVLRVDKLTLSALEATLLEYASGRASATVPVVRMIQTTVEEIEVRATALAGSLLENPYLKVDTITGTSTVGGGSAPGSSLPTRLVRLRPRQGSVTELEARLRSLQPPIVSRIENDGVLLDLRTVMPEHDKQLTTLLSDLD